MPISPVPSVEDVQGSDLELERLRDAMQVSLPNRYDDAEEIHRQAEATRARYANVPVPTRAFSVGDTLSEVERLGFLNAEDREKALKLRKERRVASKSAGAIDWGADMGSILVDMTADLGTKRVDLEADLGSKRVDLEVDLGTKRVDMSISGHSIDDDREKEEMRRAMKVPGSPSGYADNLSTMRILELWRNKPMSELDAALKRLAKVDPFAMAAVGDSVRVFTEAQRMEAKRVLNSEWRIDMTWANHDFALPDSTPSRRRDETFLNPVQKRLVDVLTSIASRTVLSDRNHAFGFGDESSGSRFSLHEPFGGLLTPSGSFLDRPGTARSLFSDASWALGIHGDRRSMLDVVADVVAPAKDSWLRDQIDFFSSWLSPASRDILGDHRMVAGKGPLALQSLSPYRTMLGVRALFGDAPSLPEFSGGGPATNVFYGADGLPMLLGTISDSDPLYSRANFTPNWEAIRTRHMYESTLRVGRWLGIQSTKTSVDVQEGYIFDPYNQSFVHLKPSYVVTDEWKLKRIHQVEDDHIVALKYAWERGFKDLYLGAMGDPARMRSVLQLMMDFGQGQGAFRNYLNLTYTARATNQAKSDRGPSEWMPAPIAETAAQHAANLFYVNRYRKVIDQLRAGQSRLDGGVIDPDFMPTSLAEQRAIQRVLRGWDQHGNTLFGRLNNERQRFYMETLVLPDLTEDAWYLQARHSALLTYMNLGLSAATWRTVPWNQAYLFARKYVVPVVNRAWMLATFDPDALNWQLPEHFRAGRSRRLHGGRLRSFMDEMRAQNTTRFILDPDGVEHAFRSGVVAPTFGQSFRYAWGSSTPFGVGDSKSRVPDWYLRKRSDFNDAIVDQLRQFLSTGDQRLLKDAPDWFRDLGSDEARATWARNRSEWVFQALQRHPDMEEAILRAYLPADLSRSIRSGALRDFGDQFQHQILAHSGRERLNAAPLLEDLARIFRDGRSSGTPFLRTVSRAGGAVATDWTIKVGDYGLRGVLSGRGDALASNFRSIPTITAIEYLASITASMTGQKAYVDPHYGRTSLLGHDLFAFARFRPRMLRSSHFSRWMADAAGMTLSAFQPVGGLRQFERLWEQARNEALLGFAAEREAVDRLRAQTGGDFGDLLERRRAASKRVAINDLPGMNVTLRNLERNLGLLTELNASQRDISRMRTASAWSSLGIRPGSPYPFAEMSEVPRRIRDAFSDAFQAERSYEMINHDYLTTRNRTRRLRSRISRLNAGTGGEDWRSSLLEARSELDQLDRQIAASKRIADELAFAERSLARAQARFDQRFGPDVLPDLLRRGLDPNTSWLRRTWIDLQVSNPRTVMRAGRLAHAPVSVAKSFAAVGKAFTVDAWAQTVLHRPGSLEGVRASLKAGRGPQIGYNLLSGGLERGARYGMHGLSLFGVFESMARYDRASGLLDDAGGWSGLDAASRSEVVQYAQPGIGTQIFDRILPVVTADPVGATLGAVNNAFSSQVRGRLLSNGEFRGEQAASILSGRAPLADQYAYRDQLKRLREASIFLGTGDSVSISSTVRHYMETNVAQQAAMRRLEQRREAAVTAKQRQATQLALVKAAAKVPMMADTAFQRKARKYMPPVSDRSMKVFSSRPYATYADLSGYSRLDSLQLFARLGDSSDRRRLNEETRRIADSSRVSRDLQRLVVDTLPTERTPGIRGEIVRRENLRAAREQLAVSSFEAQRLYQRQARTAIGAFFVEKFFGQRALPDTLTDWERRHLAVDAIQTSQRCRPK